ncbi:la protein 1-like [Salvia divinorum]|uniref:La protein 1-like n=1 Tax=Salvia divinorum TaxID=28513 RepID=A0ABD1HBR3_SALDI
MAPLEDETAKKVIRQVEFYFSDSNLPRDKFMMKTISENDDGMVSLSLLCSFSRMRGHLSLGDVKPEDVSEDTVQAVAETLKTSTFLKISEDGKKVGRVSELPKPEEVIKQLDDRTIAASPLEYDVKLEHVESFFSQHAKVNSVRLPRHVSDYRLFCGAALIEFSSVEDAANILKQTLSYSGVDLELKPKNEFDDERAKQEEEAAKTRQQVGNVKDKTNSEPDYPKGLIVAFTLKNLSAEDSTKQNDNHTQLSENLDVSMKDGEQDNTHIDSEETKKEIPEAADDTKNHVEDDESMKDGEQDNIHIDSEETKKEIPEAADDTKNHVEDGEEKEVDANGADTEAQQCEGDEKSADIPKEERLTLAACKDNKNLVSREDLKSIFQKYGTIKFIDFKIGENSGFIRFEDTASAQKARAAAVLSEKGGLVVKNFIANLDPLTGDAEKEYWNALRSGQEKHRDFKGGRGRAGGRHNNNRGGGRHSGWKHSRGRDNNDRRANKAQKV